jgi:hypothetical protein
LATETSDTRVIRSLLASTMENTMMSGVVQDAIFDASPLTRRLRAAGQLKVVNGGERLRISIDFAKNGSAKSYTDLDPLDIVRRQTQTSGFFAWKQYSSSVVISGREMRINKGNQSRLFGLLDERLNNAAKSVNDVITTGLYTDGTGNGSKNITGLEAAIEDTPGSTAYAGVPVGNTAWRNQVQLTVGAAAVNMIPKLRTVWNDCSQGSGGTDSSPNLIIMPQAQHESFEALIEPRVRYEQNPSGGADAGISVLKYKGADVIWSDYCTSGVAYVLNLNHMFMYVHEDANFTETEEGLQKPINQDSLVTQILFMGNFMVNNRRKLGKLAGLT